MILGALSSHFEPCAVTVFAGKTSLMVKYVEGSFDEVPHIRPDASLLFL